jgi:hypothetical protein
MGTGVLLGTGALLDAFRTGIVVELVAIPSSTRGKSMKTPFFCCRIGPLMTLTTLILFIGAGTWSGYLRAEQPKDSAKVDQPSWPPGHFSVPYYENLSRKDVREEIGLNAEQNRKLKELSQKFFEASRKAYGTEDWSKLSPEERKKKFAETVAENKSRTDQARKDIDALLTREQLEKLQAINLRQQAAQLLWSYNFLRDKLGLTKEQQDQFRKNREELMSKTAELQQQIQKLYDQAGKTTLELLTPEQREKLKEVRSKGLGK